VQCSGGRGVPCCDRVYTLGCDCVRSEERDVAVALNSPAASCPLTRVVFGNGQKTDMNDEMATDAQEVSPLPFCPLPPCLFTAILDSTLPGIPCSGVTSCCSQLPTLGRRHLHREIEKQLRTSE
jgi:hypothetical protein